MGLFATNYGPVEDIEVLWTLIALLGAVFSAYNLRDARQDLRLLTQDGVSNGRLFLAKTARISEAARFVKQIIFAIVGVLAMLLESPPVDQLSSTQFVIGIAVRWGLIIAAALTTFQSYLAFRTRQEFRR